jgi:DNA-binding transcriptional LysR family regulator
MAVFVAAVEEGSLVAAARRFKLSQSMAGKHVAALEEQLQVRLLHRSTRSLNLTEAGSAYYLRCKQILETVEDANAEAQQAQTKVRGTLRITAPTTFSTMHLGPIIGSFLESYPDVTIEMHLSDQYVDLIEQGMDLAIRIGKLQDSDLIAKRLTTCKMVYCAAPSYLKRYGIPKTIDDLRAAPRLAFSDAISPGDWNIVDPRGKAHMVNGNLRLAANNMEMLLSSALAGIGVAYGPDFVFGASITSGILHTFLDDHKTPELAVHAVYPTKRYSALKLRRFIEHLEDHLNKTSARTV